MLTAVWSSAALLVTYALRFVLLGTVARMDEMFRILWGGNTFLIDIVKRSIIT